MRLFSFGWHPFAVDKDVDYSTEPMTLVTFELAEVPDGTMLMIAESGFDGIPLARRADAFFSKKIPKYVEYMNAPARAKAAPVFAALGDKTRLPSSPGFASMDRIRSRLTDGSSISRQAITKHLSAHEVGTRSKRAHRPGAHL